jgi:hypothetical protein
MTYELLLVPRAEVEVAQITDFLTQRSPQGASAWSDRWLQVLADLRADPFQHSLAPESNIYSADVRQVLFKTRREGSTARSTRSSAEGIYIIRVRGPRQDLVRRREMRRKP